MTSLFHIGATQTRTAHFAILSVLSACAFVSDDDVDASKLGIFNGEQEIPDGNITTRRMVTVAGALTCTGTLLRNGIVLTAKHCFNTPVQTCDFATVGDCGAPEVAPQNTPVTQMSSGTTISGGNGGYAQTAPDTAMLLLASPFSVNGSTLGFSTQLFYGNTNDLLSQVQFNPGRGLVDCSTNSGLRSHDPAIESMNWSGDNRYFRYDRDTSGPNENRAFDSGDSGGAYFTPDLFDDLEHYPVTGVVDFKTNDGSGCPSGNGTIKIDQVRNFIHNQLSTWSGDGDPTTPDFVENFNDPDVLSSFTFTTPPSAVQGPPNWFIQSGFLEQDSNVHSNIAWFPGTHAVFDGLAVSDGWVWTNTILSSDDDGAGLIARYRDDCNYLRFSADESRNYAWITKVMNCQATVLGETLGNVVDWSSINQTSMWFRLDGCDLRGYINGNQIVSANDCDVTAGKVGFYAWGMGNNEVRFGDLLVEHF